MKFFRSNEQQPQRAPQNKTGYCMKCKNKVELDNAIVEPNARGCLTLKGNCKVCGTKVFTILAKPK